METRLAQPDDAPLLAALHAESFGEARWSVEQIADSLALTTTQAQVAQENGILHGFILCQIISDEAEILTFCVSPNARRRGTGKFLLLEAIAAARRKNARQLFLEVAVDNSVAIALYEKTGFRKTGRRPGYYKRNGKAIDAVMMELAL